MKLFVWKDFCPDYSGGLAFAIAKDESEARKLVERGRGYAVYEWGTLSVYRVDQRIAYSVNGGG